MQHNHLCPCMNVLQVLISETSTGQCNAPWGLLVSSVFILPSWAKPRVLRDFTLIHAHWFGNHGQYVGIQRKKLHMLTITVALVDLEVKVNAWIWRFNSQVFKLHSVWYPMWLPDWIHSVWDEDFSRHVHLISAMSCTHCEPSRIELSVMLLTSKMLFLREIQVYLFIYLGSSLLMIMHMQFTGHFS